MSCHVTNGKKSEFCTEQFRANQNCHLHQGVNSYTLECCTGLSVLMTAESDEVTADFYSTVTQSLFNQTCSMDAVTLIKSNENVNKLVLT